MAVRRDLDLGSLATCAICIDVYENPLILPCGHSFCGPPRTCMSSLVTQTDIMRCAVCKRVIDRHAQALDRLPKNYALASLIEGFQELDVIAERKSLKEDTICAVHEEEKDQFCHNCNYAMCLICYRDHDKSHVIKTILLRPIRESRPWDVSAHRAEQSHQRLMRFVRDTKKQLNSLYASDEDIEQNTLFSVEVRRTEDVVARRLSKYDDVASKVDQFKALVGKCRVDTEELLYVINSSQLTAEPLRCFELRKKRSVVHVEDIDLESAVVDAEGMLFALGQSSKLNQQVLVVVEILNDKSLQFKETIAFDTNGARIKTIAICYNQLHVLSRVDKKNVIQVRDKHSLVTERTYDLEGVDFDHTKYWDIAGNNCYMVLLQGAFFSNDSSWVLIFHDSAQKLKIPLAPDRITSLSLFNDTLFLSGVVNVLIVIDIDEYINRSYSARKFRRTEVRRNSRGMMNVHVVPIQTSHMMMLVPGKGGSLEAFELRIPTLSSQSSLRSFDVKKHDGKVLVCRNDVMISYRKNQLESFCVTASSCH